MSPRTDPLVTSHIPSAHGIWESPHFPTHSERVCGLFKPSQDGIWATHIPSWTSRGPGRGLTALDGYRRLAHGPSRGAVELPLPSKLNDVVTPTGGRGGLAKNPSARAVTPVGDGGRENGFKL
jgi:hypothetical protein